MIENGHGDEGSQLVGEIPDLDRFSIVVERCDRV